MYSFFTKFIERFIPENNERFFKTMKKEEKLKKITTPATKAKDKSILKRRKVTNETSKFSFIDSMNFVKKSKTKFRKLKETRKIKITKEFFSQNFFAVGREVLLLLIMFLEARINRVEISPQNKRKTMREKTTQKEFEKFV